jgi:putative SOS response-associated peptidase YedK
MCGKYHISTEDENLDFREAVARLMLAHPGTDIRTGDILPGQIAPVYTARGLVPLRFGYRPSHMKRLLINARSETAQESPMFGPLLRRSRVLVPARAFYEWSPAKQAFLFGRPDSGLIYMAGLAFPGSPLGSFVILTRDAAGAPARVHPRMPVIFDSPELQSAWLRQDSLAPHLLRLPDQTEYSIIAG